MRINQNTVLQGKRVTLVPYTSAHVPKYHEWMKSEELQRLTASEPLSLEQEYEMQRSWREDADKCTFIVLDTDKWSKQTTTEEDCMVGDVNLFLTDSEDPTLGEIEIMIAEASYRGRGFGKEATLIMMSYEPSITYNHRNIGSCLIPSKLITSSHLVLSTLANSGSQGFQTFPTLPGDARERKWDILHAEHVIKLPK
uniref:N-acetyltransferase 9 isoform X2 n=1 Tax=Podarcis muralis TaxID=64176 RepID=UPI00109FF114|nr:N-acetyltransferase 9 isoform X2 [Podarcis muralis]